MVRKDRTMKVPRFKTEREEHRFWAEHGLEDIDEEELADVRLDAVRPAKLALPVRLDHRTAALLKRLARRRGIGPSSLVAMWIKERVDRDAT
jgi:hypothetical protein